MLYIIGTGLESYKDISLKSFEILKEADLIYQECYTCIQRSNFEEIEKIIGKKIIMADRSTVEEKDEIVENSKTKNVVFLVAGTPFFATTHIDLYMRAKEKNITAKVIHNTSILNVKGCYGLYSYNFGKTISIPYFTETYKPMSFYDNIYNNYKNGLHTLCLLDIKTDENRFMTVNEAVEQILYCSKTTENTFITENTEIIAVCRFSTDDEFVKFDTAKNLLKIDFGSPLHSLIIPSKLSIIEREFVEDYFSIKK